MSEATTSRPAPAWVGRGPEALALALLLLFLGGALRPAGAEPAAADSVHRLSPRAVLWRSAVLPGWGQYRNGRPLKALGFGAAGAGCAAAAVAAVRLANRAATPELRQERTGRRNTRVLYLLATATLAALDAYVDAQLSDFDTAPWNGATGDLAGVRLVRCWGRTAGRLGAAQ